MFSLNKPSFQQLARSLDASSLRQRVIANNIANVDTPKFKKSSVEFENLLQQELNSSSSIVGYRTNVKHFFIGASSQQIIPQVVKDTHSVINNNLNNVDIDSEMALMAKNQLTYSTQIQQVSHEIKKMRASITGGR